MVDLQLSISQLRFGELVGVSQQAVSDLVRRGILATGEPASVWLHGYCSHLREQAAGRAAAGDLDLAAERAGLARAQRERIEMQNAVTRRELAPVPLLEMALATMGRKVAAILEAIPGDIKRRSGRLTAEDIDIITAEITKARNVAASAQLDMRDDDESDSPGDPEGAEES
ncbi:phage terminase Nu1 subunit (DNA packaging protein) [Oxalobacteraceae bacterium GrIS 1.11]